MSNTEPEASIRLAHLLAAAVSAAIISGLITAVLHQLFLVPLILQAELFEAAGQAHSAAASQPHRDAAQIAYTILFDILGAFGFAALLAACYAVVGRVSWQQGAMWGLAGFASFSLAPALGLAPELPGTPAADIVARQLWWVATAASTAAGLACVLRMRGWGAKMLAVVLIAWPHILGAPRAPDEMSDVPTALTHAFVAWSLVASLVLWVLLGALTALFVARWSNRTRLAQSD
ncbi:MAG: CbtA family protein [Betaproteobacteria bacterium]